MLKVLDIKQITTFNMLLLVERFIFRLHFSSKVQINVKYTNDLYLEWKYILMLSKSSTDAKSR